MIRKNFHKKIFFSLMAIISILLVGTYLNISRAVSNDTSLKLLTIEPLGSGLVQDIDNNKIYRVKVDNNITSVKVNAVPSGSGATVDIEGNNNLIVGTNKVTVNVTAESGEKSSYIIYVRRATKAIAEQEVIPNVQEGYVEPQNNISDNNEVINITDNNEGTQKSAFGQDNGENVKATDQNLVEEDLEIEMQNTENKGDQNNNQKREKNKLIIFIEIIVIVIAMILLIVIFSKKNNGKH